MNKHVSLEFGIIEESLLAAVVVALELSEGQFVTMNRHVLLQASSIIENFST